MSNKDRQNKDSKAVDLFAPYLEGQTIRDLSNEEAETIKGGMLEPIVPPVRLGSWDDL